MNQYPRSAYDKVEGIVYFARMLDKIRLKAGGELPTDYHKNLGTGFDGRCCRFLGVTYAAIQQRVQQGGTDAEILQWCFDQGRKPNDEEVLIWNAFMTKRGWRDAGTPRLNERLAEIGLPPGTVLTMFEFIDLDEGRPPRQ